MRVFDLVIKICMSLEVDVLQRLVRRSWRDDTLERCRWRSGIIGRMRQAIVMYDIRYLIG